MALQPSTWRGRSEQILLHPVGCEARKIPAEGDVFFLDFYLYRTYRELARRCRGQLQVGIGFINIYRTQHSKWREPPQVE